LVPESELTEPAPADEPAFDDDEPIARISLRLPQSVKARVDEKAAAEQISTNAWLIRAVMDALAEPSRPPLPPRPPVPGPIFGPDGPFGPHGVFGPHGPFGIFTDRGERSSRREAQGRVQGWVR
jgi:Ribbon-helix-helix protein, copG family